MTVIDLFKREPARWDHVVEKISKDAAENCWPSGGNARQVAQCFFPRQINDEDPSQIPLRLWISGCDYFGPLYGLPAFLPLRSSQ